MEGENAPQEAQGETPQAQTPVAATAETPAEAGGEQQSGQTQEQTAPNGYQGENFVEFTPDQQKRLNQLAKKAGKAERESGEWRTVAQQQAELIAELSKGQQQIVQHLQTNNYAEAEQQIISQQQQAFERGDLPTYNALNGKLIDLRVQKAIADKAPKELPKVVQQFQTQDVVEAAVQKGAISRDDATVYQEWANETDNYGNPLRPWVNERDARNLAAAAEGQAVFRNPAMAGKPFAEKLKEIDRRMGIQNRNQTGSGVIPSGNLTGNGKTSTVKMSSWAEDLAVKTSFAGKGKSRADHIEAYRKQMAEVKGARR